MHSHQSLDEVDHLGNREPGNENSAGGLHLGINLWRSLGNKLVARIEYSSLCIVIPSKEYVPGIREGSNLSKHPSTGEAIIWMWEDEIRSCLLGVGQGTVWQDAPGALFS